MHCAYVACKKYCMLIAEGNNLQLLWTQHIDECQGGTMHLLVHKSGATSASEGSPL